MNDPGHRSAGAGRHHPRTTLRLERSPLEPTVLGRLAAAAVVLVAAGTLVGLPLARGAPPALDTEVASSVTAPAGSAASLVALVLGHLGHLALMTAVAAAIAVVARRRSGRWDVAWLLAAVLGGATTLTGILKVLVDRSRPDDAIVSTLSAAYPSGHAVRAVAVFGLAALLVRCWSPRPLVPGAAVPIAVLLVALNGAARVVLGVHWPTDVLVGVALGTTWLLVCWLLLRPVAVHSSPPNLEA